MTAINSEGSTSLARWGCLQASGDEVWVALERADSGMEIIVRDTQTA
jgi:hypothetical protein